MSLTSVENTIDIYMTTTFSYVDMLMYTCTVFDGAAKKLTVNIASTRITDFEIDGDNNLNTTAKLLLARPKVGISRTARLIIDQ